MHASHDLTRAPITAMSKSDHSPQACLQRNTLIQAHSFGHTRSGSDLAREISGSGRRQTGHTSLSRTIFRKLPSIFAELPKCIPIGFPTGSIQINKQWIGLRQTCNWSWHSTVPSVKFVLRIATHNTRRGQILIKEVGWVKTFLNIFARKSTQSQSVSFRRRLDTENFTLLLNRQHPLAAFFTKCCTWGAFAA